MTDQKRQERIGFIGLGRMGEPMARNLLRAGQPIQAWNRSAPALDGLVAEGAERGETPAQVLRGNPVTLLMLANEAAIDAAIGRNTPDLAANVCNRLIVQMGTTSPGYSKALAADVIAAGGRYVEAPVSGSRKPAEDGALVGMLAGDAASVDIVRELIVPICASSFVCGAVPNALQTKLAVNLYLIAMVAGLVEATHFAERAGLDLELFRAVLDAGPMASAVSRIKLEKLVTGDFAAQASIDDVLMNARLVEDATRAAGAAAPLIAEARRLLEETQALGHGGADMIGTLHAHAARSGVE